MPPPIELIAEDVMVPALDPGIALYVRNKRPASLRAFTPARTVLFVHGATYPSSTTFDFAVDGVSWMDCIAAGGYDVYLVDLRGYGRSTRPPEMAAAPDAHAPVVRTETALKDIAAAIDFIRARRAVPRLSLIGWSWGTSLVATYATLHTEKVERLVLDAPIWLGPTLKLAAATGARLPCYRTVTRADAHARWYNGVPEEAKATLLAPGVFDAWADATFATDPQGAALDPPALRVPNGVIADFAEYWWAGKAYYEPARITAPALLVTTGWDHDVPPAMARALFPLLTHSPGKRLLELPQGTHAAMLETNRFALFDAVQAFLDEAT